MLQLVANLLKLALHHDIKHHDLDARFNTALSRLTKYVLIDSFCLSCFK